jgi:hypothetical protein
MNRCQSTLALWPFFLRARRGLLPASLPGLQRICYDSAFCTEVKASKTENGLEVSTLICPHLFPFVPKSLYQSSDSKGDTVLVTLGKSIACSLYLARLSGKPCLLQALGPDAHSRKLNVLARVKDS